jgi:DUF4097 and DUF4098 domain-containing protein YvlB
MTEYRFETHEPVALYVEVGRGRVHLQTADTTETTIGIIGRDADDVRVEQNGRQITVVAPRERAGFLGGDASLDVSVTLPHESELAGKTGSADLTVDGLLSSCQFKTGSGDVRLGEVQGPCVVETGSGNVLIEAVGGGLRVKSGSGDIAVQHASESVAVSTGSGDVEIGTSNGPAVVKTGSGDLRVVDADSDVSLMTGSGDLVVGTARRGKFSVKGASGDVRIGIPAGTPVWTDLSTVTGSIQSNLEGVGQPEDGTDHVELRIKNVSGDIVLNQV